MKRNARIFTIFVLGIIGIILVAGCMKTDGNSPPSLENAIPAHPSVSVESDDFPVLISINGLGNVTDTCRTQT